MHRVLVALVTLVAALGILTAVGAQLELDTPSAPAPVEVTGN